MLASLILKVSCFALILCLLKMDSSGEASDKNSGKFPYIPPWTKALLYFIGASSWEIGTYLSHRQTAKAQASLHIHTAILQELLLFAHIVNGSS